MYLHKHQKNTIIKHKKTTVKVQKTFQSPVVTQKILNPVLVSVIGNNLNGKFNVKITHTTPRHLHNVTAFA